jgi:hypothetical protein
MQIINDKIKMKVLTGALKSIGGAGPPSQAVKVLAIPSKEASHQEEDPRRTTAS